MPQLIRSPIPDLDQLQRVSTLIQDNPWAVRRVLDALAAVSTTPNNASKRVAR